MNLLTFLSYSTVFFCGMIAAFIIIPHVITGFDTDFLDSKPIGFWQEVNSTDSYYCVWVDNLTRKTISTTEYHEACHELVHKDYEHFCS